MSLRTFTVFQDAPSGGVQQPKISRPNAMVTRSQRFASNVATGENVATTDDLSTINKENYNPATGECAGPSTSGLKKRKTTVLATKVQPAPASSKSKGSSKDKDAQPELGPEQKKRKASAPSSALKSKATKKDTTKGSGTAKKTSKRTGSKKVAPMPKLKEEDAGEIDRIADADADARCYELTVKPLADVSQAYEEVDVFESFTTCSTSTTAAHERNVKFSTVKESSVEPELRDYFQPTQATFPSTAGRLLRALSEDAPARTFSTPERRKIYSAFTFSSPSAPTSSKSGPVAEEGL